MKNWLSKRQNRIKIYTVLILTGLLICLIYPFEPSLSLRIVYERGLIKEASNQIWFDEGSGYEEEKEIEGSMNLGSTYENKWFNDYFMMDFDLKGHEKITGMIIFLYRPSSIDNYQIPIQCIEIYNRGICIEKYSPEEIHNKLEVQNVRTIETGSSFVITTKADESPTMVATPSFVKQYNALAAKEGDFKQNVIFAWILFGVLFICVDILAEKVLILIKNKNRVSIQLEDFIALGVLIGVFLMASGSQPFSHGDEDVLMRGVEFFKSHWLPPDICGKEALGTFSYAGFSRLSERTLYYTLAGKVAWTAEFFFHIVKSYRVFNVCIWVMLTILYLCKKKEHPWLFLALFTTPQLWYLHSYALSDTWDLFLSILVIYELAEKESGLYHYLDWDWKNWKQLLRLALLSALFAGIFMGKKNYLLMILFAFVELVRVWINRTEKGEKRRLLFRYLLIICGCFGILFCQKALYEHFTIGFASNADLSLAQEYAMDGWKPTDYVEKGRNSLEAQGETYLGVLRSRGGEIAEALAVTSTGSYSWYTLNSGSWYLTVMLGLYLIILAEILIFNFKYSKGGGVDNLYILSFIGLAYLMVVYNCWTSDFQAQGRYLMMIWPITAYYSRKADVLYQNKWCRSILGLTTLLSLYSFFVVGIGTLCR